MKNNPFPIKQCDSLDLSFDEQGSAYSNNYADIYFQPGIGLDEKKHVFLQGNNLPDNWLNKPVFNIAETGFGTGLNFLNTIKLWQASSKENQQLHYISCELHPLNITQLAQALAQFPQLTEQTHKLLKKYPKHLIFGFHRLHFPEDNVTLTLIFGDAVDAFEQLDANIDAWFLDGFGPSKNPQMWSDKLFKAIANLSHIGTTAATFTVARKIRDGLSAVGFEINKTTGFGQKREMLTATLISEHKLIKKQPWAQTFKAHNQQSFTILGAGIAGLSLADKLSQLGKQVTLIDRQEKPCLETSGNPQAMVMPSFDLNDSPEARFYLSAFLYAIRYYSPHYYHQAGVHQLAFSEKQKHWQENFLKNFELPKDVIHQFKDGLLYPQAGWLDTQGHAKSIISKINDCLQAEVTKIEQKDGLWHLYNKETHVHSTKNLILANGIQIKKLLPDYELPITAKYGEISYFKSADTANEIANCPQIQLSKGYITPSWHGTQTMGASFEHIAKDKYFDVPQSSPSHWHKNTALWKHTPYAEFLHKNISYKSRAGIRVTTPDHLPICGPLINQQQFKQDYHDIRHGKHWKHYPIPQNIEGLYVFTGLGSRGFTSAPILSEFLCNQILGRPSILNNQMKKSIHPNRFLFKQLKHLK